MLPFLVLWRLRYGQTGSGKTHTIFGTRDQPGLLQRAPRADAAMLLIPGEASVRNAKENAGKLQWASPSAGPQDCFFPLVGIFESAEPSETQI